MTTLTKEPAQTPSTNGTARRTQYLVPAANIVENKDGFVLQAEMPGVSKNGLEVTVENNELVIVGHRSEPDFKGEIVYRESRQLDYRRAFEIDPSIDVARISAKIDQGVLTLQLPKAESVKPRKITVTD